MFNRQWNCKKYLRNHTNVIYVKLTNILIWLWLLKWLYCTSIVFSVSVGCGMYAIPHSHNVAWLNAYMYIHKQLTQLNWYDTEYLCRFCTYSSRDHQCQEALAFFPKNITQKSAPCFSFLAVYFYVLLCRNFTKRMTHRYTVITRCIFKTVQKCLVNSIL